jgi:hypothetical protein
MKRKERWVRFLLLIYSNPKNWEHPVYLYQPGGFSADELAEMKREGDALQKEIEASGEFISARGLFEPAAAKTVREIDGATIVTDGPFAEAKEHLAGVFEIECESMDRAVEIASRFQDTRFGSIVVRQVMTA